jgi:hypothetical protein
MLTMTQAARLRREGMAVDVTWTALRPWSTWRSAAMTSWCWTGTFPACTVTTSAGPLPLTDPKPGC